MSIATGTRIGRYEVQALIGAGGMGEVYRAHDAKLDRTVALKFLATELAADHKRMSRFVQEARAASALNHPHIITIYEIEDAAAPPYIATEFIDGETLRARMQRGGLRLADVLEIVTQIASALAAAHAAGIVHRDIKPENVMIRRDGYVKILDFGLAKLSEHKVSAVDTEAATRALVNTDPGAVMGTVAYMSPEQARGLEVDARTDLWSLGVLLYELVTGHLPFTGATPTDTILAIVVREPPPLSAYVTDVPEALEWIVAKALTKDKEERYQTARELVTDLRRLKQRLDVHAEIERSTAPHTSSAPATTGAHETRTLSQTSAARTAAEVNAASTVSSAEFVAAKLKTHKKGAAIAVALVVAVLGGVGFGLYKFFGQRQSAANSPVAPLLSMKFTKLPVGERTSRTALSPDGKFIALVSGAGGRQSLRLRQVTTPGEQEIVAPADVNYGGLAFAPDGGSIYYVTCSRGTNHCDLYRVPVIGGDAQKLNAEVNSDITFAPDGKRLAFVRYNPKVEEQKIVLVNADGSGEQVVRTSRAYAWLNSPKWSPDGHTLAYAVGDKDDAGEYRTIETLNLADGQTAALSPTRWRSLSDPAWLPDGTGLIVSAVPRAAPPDARSQLWHLAYPGGAPYQITNDPEGFRDVRLTADGRTLLTWQSSLSSNIWIVPGGTTASARQITNSVVIFGELDWTPDGRIIYSAGATGAQSDLWVLNPDGSGNRQLTFTPDSEGIPRVAGDGRYIFYPLWRAGQWNLWRMSSDGGGAKELVHNIDSSGFAGASPDARWVYYWKFGEKSLKFELWRVGTDGGEPTQLREETGTYSYQLSPDGRQFFAIHRAEADKRLQIYLIPAEGGAPTRTLEKPADMGMVKWSPDSQALDFLAEREGVVNLWRLPLSGGKEQRLTDWKAYAPTYTFAWSRDGRTLAMVRDTVKLELVLIQNFR